MEINIVPLVDVLIVLIFFFIITMQFRNRTVLNITPPPVETAGENKDTAQVQVAVDSEGKFFLNNAEVSPRELVTGLQLAAGVDRGQSVLVLADEDTPLKNVTFVMDEARKAGLDSIRLQTR